MSLNVHVQTYLMYSKGYQDDDVIVQGEFPVATQVWSHPDNGCKHQTHSNTREVGTEIDVHWPRTSRGSTRERGKEMEGERGREREREGGREGEREGGGIDGGREGGREERRERREGGREYR